MASLNKVMLIGNVGKDPEVRTFDSGNKTASITLATSERYKDKSGEYKTQTEWHNIVFWGKLAEIVEAYVKKGSSIYVEGSLRNRSYEKDGQTRYITEINASQMQMLGKKDEGGSGYETPKQESRELITPSEVAQEAEGDLPF